MALRPKPVLLLLVAMAGITALTYTMIAQSHGEDVAEKMPTDDLDLVLQTEVQQFLTQMARRSFYAEQACDRGTSGVSIKEAASHIVVDKTDSLLYCLLHHPHHPSSLAQELRGRGLWGPDAAVMKTSTSVDLHPKEYRTRFLVVRHPFERLLSCYVSNFENAINEHYYKTYGKSMIRHYRERPDNVPLDEVDKLLEKVDADRVREQALGNLYANPLGPTFSEFIAFVVSERPDDEHWGTYHDECAPCSLQYNFILRFEDLTKEGDTFALHLHDDAAAHGWSTGNKIFRNLYGDPEPKLQMDRGFDGTSVTEVFCSYFSQLNSTVLQKLVKKYGTDFQLFGYLPDKYLRCADDYVKQ